VFSLAEKQGAFISAREKLGFAAGFAGFAVIGILV